MYSANLRQTQVKKKNLLALNEVEVKLSAGVLAALRLAQGESSSYFKRSPQMAV